ncbi:MAG: hydrogenase maturation nickel metallochaperone HypA [Actinomycetota bacterium]|nr:hydrogenase maturation nickel metallochaperone HypA [Actinomycetota bacterium]
MHEMAVMMGVVDQVTERLGDARIAEVSLTVGKLSGVVPDSLRFCFELACAGTALEGAELDIDEPAGQAECRSCALQFTVDQPFLLCPCGSADIQVIGGQELLIRSVKVA